MLWVGVGAVPAGTGWPVDADELGVRDAAMNGFGGMVGESPTGAEGADRVGRFPVGATDASAAEAGRGVLGCEDVGCEDAGCEETAACDPALAGLTGTFIFVLQFGQPIVLPVCAGATARSLSH